MIFIEGKIIDKLVDLAELKHQCGLRNGVEFWREKDVKYALDYMFIKYGPNWKWMYNAHNSLNPFYWKFGNILNYFTPIPNKVGVTPFDIKPGEKYAPSSGSGVTPFDILK